MLAHPPEKRAPVIIKIKKNFQTKKRKKRIFYFRENPFSLSPFTKKKEKGKFFLLFPELISP